MTKAEVIYVKLMSSNMRIKLYTWDTSIDFNHSEISRLTFMSITPFYDYLNNLMIATLK